MAMIDEYDLFSPIDFRYYQKLLRPYLSENAFVRYKLDVEMALVRVFNRRGKCTLDVVEEIARACKDVTTAEIYLEEKRIGHDIRAMVNAIQKRISDIARPFVHMTATSYDINDTANAARFRNAILLVLVPALVKLARTLITLAEREAATAQIGRTHGQHAVPITFGFAIAQYINRLGESIVELLRLTDMLVGKFSGAVGAYNASSLYFDDPEEFEAEVLAEMGLKPAAISTQIVPPEAMIRLLSEVVNAAGIMADLAQSMRHLQRTEIGEVGEAVEEATVGSSTMPQKMNPVGLENVISILKILIGREVTVRLDQLSDHQRDLTNSASSRTYGEIICYALAMAVRLNRVMGKLRVNIDSLERNFGLTRGRYASEPLYVILAGLGHPDAHEAVRVLARRSENQQVSFEEVYQRAYELQPYWDNMSEKQRELLASPKNYTGIATQKALAIAAGWQDRLESLVEKEA